MNRSMRSLIDDRISIARAETVWDVGRHPHAVLPTVNRRTSQNTFMYVPHYTAAFRRSACAARSATALS
eukprot:9399-Heterococcus_DN1.PRE.6